MKELETKLVNECYKEIDLLESPIINRTSKQYVDFFYLSRRVNQSMAYCPKRFSHGGFFGTVSELISEKYPQREYWDKIWPTSQTFILEKEDQLNIRDITLDRCNEFKVDLPIDEKKERMNISEITNYKETCMPYLTQEDLITILVRESRDVELPKKKNKFFGKDPVLRIASSAGSGALSVLFSGLLIKEQSYELIFPMTLCGLFSVFSLCVDEIAWKDQDNEKERRYNILKERYNLKINPTNFLQSSNYIK